MSRDLAAVPPPPLPPPVPAPFSFPSPRPCYAPPLSCPAKQLISLTDTCLHLGRCQKPQLIVTRDFYNGTQEGPTCGLFVISLLLDNEISVAELKEIALRLGYSYNGEIFSNLSMLNLLNFTINSLSDGVKYRLNTPNIEIDSCEGNLFNKHIIGELLKRKMLIVPYDCDYNGYPCCMKGHKAHWALITGIILRENMNSADLGPLDPDNIFVTARHGKSNRVCVWRLKDLSDSNSNLEEFSPKREDDELDYLLPGGGIGGNNGLKSKFIIVYRPEEDA